MKEKRYIKSFFIKVLICIVLFLITSIFVNYSDSNLLLFISMSGTNIYFDTGFSVGIMDDEIAKEIIKKHTADKILFATDSPWLCQGWVKDRIKNLGLSKEEEQKIFYDNGAKILCL